MSNILRYDCYGCDGMLDSEYGGYVRHEDYAALARQLAERGWQSIESAPKDGTRVLVFCPSEDDFWKEDLAFYYTGIWGEGWTHSVHGSDTDFLEPTLWMPRPPAPDGKEGA